MDVQQRVLELLRGAGAPFEVLPHAPITSAAHASRVRGTPLEIGGKSVLMKLDRGIGFAIVVLSGARRLSNPRLRQALGVRRYRFATPEELLEHTGLHPGAVPPFGEPVFTLPMFCDAHTAATDEIAFTLGVADRSVRMATADWLRVAQPTAVVDISSPPPPDR